MCLCVLVPGRGTGASRGALDLVVIDVINVEEAPGIEPVAIRLRSACLEAVGFFSRSVYDFRPAIANHHFRSTNSLKGKWTV